MAALTVSGCVTGPICPSPSKSMTATRGSDRVSSLATPRDEAGESVPIMYRTGTPNLEKAFNGVGSPSNSLAHPLTLTMEEAIGVCVAQACDLKRRSPGFTTSP